MRAAGLSSVHDAMERLAEAAGAWVGPPGSPKLFGFQIYPLVDLARAVAAFRSADEARQGMTCSAAMSGRGGRCCADVLAGARAYGLGSRKHAHGDVGGGADRVATSRYRLSMLLTRNLDTDRPPQPRLFSCTGEGVSMAPSGVTVTVTVTVTTVSHTYALLHPSTGVLAA